MLVMRDTITRIRSGHLVKTAVDQTPKRSMTTQLIAIQPPPLPTINGVVGVLRTSLLHREPLQSIRQALPPISCASIRSVQSARTATPTPSLASATSPVWLINERTEQCWPQTRSRGAGRQSRSRGAIPFRQCQRLRAHARNRKRPVANARGRRSGPK